MEFKLDYKVFLNNENMPRYFTDTFTELDITYSNNALVKEDSYVQVSTIDYVEMNTDVARAILRSIVCGRVKQYKDWCADASDKRKAKYRSEFLLDLERIKEKWNNNINSLVNDYVVSFSSLIDTKDRIGKAKLVSKERMIKREQVQQHIQSVKESYLKELGEQQKELRKLIRDSNRKLKQLKENKLKIEGLTKNFPNMESMSSRALSVSINSYTHDTSKLVFID